MAVIGKMINPDIEYGNPTDIRMDNGNTGVVLLPKKIVATIRQKYRDKDKQAAYEKAIAQGIVWTGQYTKDVSTGEVTPKPLEKLADEQIANLDKSLVENIGVNPLKKYWWVLAAIGVYLIISND